MSSANRRHRHDKHNHEEKALVPVGAEGFERLEDDGFNEETQPAIRAVLTKDGIDTIMQHIRDYGSRIHNRKVNFDDTGALNKLIDNIVDKHNKTQDDLLAAGFAQAFVNTYPGLRVGGLYKVAEGSQYVITKPGNFVVVTQITLGSTGTLMPPGNPQVFALNLDAKGRVANQEQFLIAVKDLVEVTPEEEALIKSTWAEPIKTYGVLKDGTPVRLKQDTTLIFHHIWGTQSVNLKAGLHGIIDTPDVNEGANEKQINKPTFIPPTMKVEFGWNVDLLHSCGISDHLDFNHFFLDLPLASFGYKYKVYVPEKRGHVEIDQSLIEPRPYDQDALNKVILSPATRRKLLAATSGKPDDLRRWGFETQKKGIGTIILEIGGPGLGKTMTAYATAEFLQKPVFVVENVMFGNDAPSFEKGLKEINERSERWGAVILWDECEVFLQWSGSDSVQDARIAAARRMFEQFKGIMFLTTNRPGMLDPAVTDRLSTSLNFEPFNEEQKRQIWHRVKPAEVQVDDFDRAIDELVKLDLNGRAALKILLNAAKQASAEGLESIPGRYLVDEAHEVLKELDWINDGRSERETNKNRDKWQHLDMPKKATKNGTAAAQQ